MRRGDCSQNTSKDEENIKITPEKQKVYTQKLKPFPLKKVFNKHPNKAKSSLPHSLNPSNPSHFTNLTKIPDKLFFKKKNKITHQQFPFES